MRRFLRDGAIAADKDEPWPYLAQGMAGFAMRDNPHSLTCPLRVDTVDKVRNRLGEVPEHLLTVIFHSV